MLFLLSLTSLLRATSAYNWANVKIGGGGGFVPGIVFNPTAKGVAYARTDIGGAYRLNADDSWTPLQDYVNDTLWHEWGTDAIATDPVDPKRVYLVVGMYTNSYDPNNAAVLRSSDYGATWNRTQLSFKAGGNMPGRGMGERLAVDPQNNKVIYLGARSGHGLWKSVDQGLSFQKVTSFTAVGTYEADPTDTTGYSNDINGLTTVTFDSTSALKNGASSRIWVGTAAKTSASVWVSNDAGATWTAPTGQPSGVFPHKMKFSKEEKALYISYNSEGGPFSAGTGSVYRVSTTGTFTDITPSWPAANGVTIGYGGLALDTLKPGTLMVAAMNLWYPDVQIFRSNNSGASWTQIWDYVNGQESPHYTYDTNKAPWINTSRASTDTKVLGWMVESLEIDPFDSDHWLYGTGETIYGGHDLTSWPKVHVSSLADGVEETSVQALLSPPGIGVPLITAVGDVGGFVHHNLSVSPLDSFENPFWDTTVGLDYAGLNPKNIIRIGESQLATSKDGGATWSLNSGVPSNVGGGTIAYGADASNIVSSAGFLINSANPQGVRISTYPNMAIVAADRVNPKYFYAGSQNGFYVSKDGGKTFAIAAQLSSNGAPSSVKVHPAVAGDVWFGTASGLFHSTNFGQTFSTIAGIQSTDAVALGKGNGTYPNVYAFCTMGGVTALRMSANAGSTWTAISNAQYGFGSASANPLAASWDTAGLVYVGTNGRGAFYGLP